MVRRILRAHGRRVAAADPEDLAELVAMRDTLEGAIHIAVRGLIENGRSYGDIARALGITRQAVHSRYRR